MQHPNKVVVWLNQIRANFLVLAVLLVLIGIALAYKYLPAGHSVNWVDASLIIFGTVLAHASVNLFNEYSDHLTGIDKNTKRTPFSGGSGMMNSGFTEPSSVLIAAIATLLIAGSIGIYFGIVVHWTLFVIMLTGAFSIVYYTPLLTKLMLGELFSGLTLGTMVVLGTFIALTATPGQPWNTLLPIEVIMISIPPGILTSLLLLLNQFPDSEADKQGGRKHLVIKLGYKNAAFVYAAGVVATFLIILILPLAGISSYWLYLGLLPLPVIFIATKTTLKFYNNVDKLIPALGANIVTVLLTDALLALAIFITLF
ncbi:MAG: prenyltransferase [Prolixibacteraceae bacterium]|jgi:1,4-dihydroxy-2-naphthoate octaprenyltransferase|nr:prenyltransferase [Prolixibacteraceae bacterium]